MCLSETAGTIWVNIYLLTYFFVIGGVFTSSFELNILSPCVETKSMYTSKVLISISQIL
jgi:hypothetical protein